MTDNSNDSRAPRDAREARGQRAPRGPRNGHETGDARARKPLREVVCEIDRDILRLLLRRNNILVRMRGDKPRLDSTEEKTIRESWEASVSRISRDARLSGHFFSLMQEVEFQPRPASARADGADEGGELGGAAMQEPPRTAFNLAPPAKHVRLHMPAPLACRATRAWLMLAAATGQPLHIAPCLMNDPIVDCVKMLNQAGASMTREDEGVSARPAAPLGASDKVIHTGDSAWNFFMLLGHYLGRPSRAKFTGDASLKLADFSSVRHFLPTLGARLVHVVPKSDGLPARLECSGILPDSVKLPADVPAELAEGILLAAPGYERAITLDLGSHPEHRLIVARILPILRAAGADVQVEGAKVRVNPGPLSLPAQPQAGMEPELALFLLALPLALGGEALLGGQWPALPAAEAGWDLLQQLGLDLRFEAGKNGGEVCARAAAPLKQYAKGDLPAGFPAAWAPLPVALAACAALRGDKAVLPVLPSGTDRTTVESFLSAVGLDLDENGRLCKKEQSSPRTGWNAPDPVWAMALALTACASPHQKLGNPGIMTGLYPPFWALYNTLPEPAVRRSAAPEAPAAAPRRRIITGVVAVPPELKDEDDY